MNRTPASHLAIYQRSAGAAMSTKSTSAVCRRSTLPPVSATPTSSSAKPLPPLRARPCRHPHLQVPPQPGRQSAPSGCARSSSLRRLCPLSARPQDPQGRTPAEHARTPEVQAAFPPAVRPPQQLGAPPRQAPNVYVPSNPPQIGHSQPMAAAPPPHVVRQQLHHQPHPAHAASSAPPAYYGHAAPPPQRYYQGQQQHPAVDPRVYAAPAHAAPPRSLPARALVAPPAAAVLLVALLNHLLPYQVLPSRSSVRSNACVWRPTDADAHGVCAAARISAPGPSRAAAATRVSPSDGIGNTQQLCARRLCCL